MNDSIIITALECCDKANCDSCPLSFDNCYKNLARFALGIINRQQAEISRMKIIQDSADQFARDLCKERILKGKPIADFEDLQDYISKEKAKAVRAFAEKLKKKTYPFPCAIGVENAVTLRAINELVDIWCEEFKE